MADAQCAQISKVLPQDGELFSPYVINCVVMSILSFTAVVGNVLILVSICRAPQFVRQPSYFLLVNLAFTDLCVGILAEPAYLVYKVSYLLNPFSVLSCYAGIAFNFLSYFLTSLSLWTAAAISLDRLLALHLHLKYNSIVTKCRVFVLIAVLLALSSVFASMFEWALDAQNTVFVCADSLALLIALLSYVRIFQIVRYHQRQISIQLSEVSFAQGGENDSLGSSFHGQHDGRVEESRRVRSETVTTKSSDKQTGKTETQDGERCFENKSVKIELQQGSSTVKNRENQECIFLNDCKVSSGQQELGEETKTVGAKAPTRSQKQQLYLSHTTVTDNGPVQPVVTAQGTYPEINRSGITDLTLLDNYVSERLTDHQTELKPALSDLEQESKTSRSELPVNQNLELTMTEIQLLKIVRDQKTGERREETSVLEDEQTENGLTKDKNCFKSLHQNYDQNYALVGESSTSAAKKETHHGEQTETNSCVENCFTNCGNQNRSQNYALVDETTLVARRETYQEEDTERITLSEDNSSFKTWGQCAYRNYALVEEGRLQPAKSKETHQKEVEKTGMDPLEDNDSFKRLYQIQNQSYASARETATVRRESNQEENVKTAENLVNHGRETNIVTTIHNQVASSNNRRTSSNSTINENQISNRSSKGFKMRHFKKSVFNMFVIWFLMLLCYLPLICTSTLVMFVGRSYSLHLSFTFTTSVMFVNSSINPIVFCWRIREFRAAVRKTLREVFGFWDNQISRLDNLSSLVNQ